MAQMAIKSMAQNLFIREDFRMSAARSVDSGFTISDGGKTSVLIPNIELNRAASSASISGISR